MTKYIYMGDRFTDTDLRGRECAAVVNSSGKCIRGKNGNMLVDFGGRRVVVVARLLRKLHSMDTSLKIGFGPLTGPFAKQLDEQGFKYDPKKIAEFEQLRDAALRLRFGDLLADAAYDKIIQKLNKKIAAHVAKKNKMHIVI